MEMTSYEPGIPCWIDLGAPDPVAAAAFYGALFGWESEEGPPEAGGYRMCLLRGRPVAGIGPQMNPDAPPYWTSYVNVIDVDATVAKVQGAGGLVFVEPMDVLTAGRMAVCADPAGAAFSLWQPIDHIGAGLVNEPGTLSWNELMTTDVEGAKAFYRTVFGWEAETSPGDMPYTEFKVDGRSMAGMMAKPDDLTDVPPMWFVYFAVEDADAAVAEVSRLGGAVLVPGMDIEPGRFATVADPQGAVFNVMQFKAGMAG